MGLMSNQEFNLEERMRFRDLVLQIERFIRFAPKGTSRDTLVREAKEFHNRISAFEKLDGPKVRGLERRLEKIIGAAA